MSRIRAALALLWAVVVMTTGCGGMKRSSPSNVFRVPLDVPPMSFDPALVAEAWSIDTIQNTFEGLVAMGEDNRAHPCLAESWALSADGRTYTFHLKRGVRFQNGRELVADDVRKSFERACSPELAAPLAANYLDDIEGMADFHAGRSTSLRGLRISDSHTISITLTTARPYFLAKLTCPVASIVATEAIRDSIHIRSIEEMVGTGPFQVTRYIDGQMVVQRAFANYHGGRPRIDAIERPVMRDPVQRLSAYKRGEIDAIQQLTRSDYLALSEDPKFRPNLRLVPKATLVYLALNVRDFPDRRVRQAIAMAIDRDQIANDCMLGTVTAAKSIVPVGVPGHRVSPAWIAPEPERAAVFLAKALRASGAPAPVLRISFAMENPDIERIADQIGAQVKAKLGIGVRLDRMDSATLIERQNSRSLSCEVSGWFADYLDPQDFVSMLLRSDSPENHWSYSNPEVDRFCREADACTDPAERLRLYSRAEDVALQDAVLVPICYWATPMLTSSRVHGLRRCTSMFLPYNTIWLDP